MKSAIRYVFFLCVGLLFGVVNAHANISHHYRVADFEIGKQLLTPGFNSNIFFDQSQEPGKDDDTLFSEEDDEDDCTIKKISAFFKSLVTFTEGFLTDHSFNNTTQSFCFEDHLCFNTTPRYIQQRMLRI